ncbi:MAG: cell division protein SepF [Actinomycetota bacterium]|nr:cell division protein SepF [Actinomycetota bacterium]
MRNLLRKALIYFGLAEEDEYEEFEEEEDYTDLYEQAPPSVRKIVRSPDLERTQRAAALRAIAMPQTKVHIVEPRSFNDAQQIADKFKANVPVIVNLQLADTDLSKRLIDFASGLTYGLDGGMQRVAEKVFLLTPSNVEVSEAEKRRLQERGLFNQY